MAPEDCREVLRRSDASGVEVCVTCGANRTFDGNHYGPWRAPGESPAPIPARSARVQRQLALLRSPNAHGADALELKYTLDARF